MNKKMFNMGIGAAIVGFRACCGTGRLLRSLPVALPLTIIMRILRKTKGDCVVSISPQELAVLIEALKAELASGTRTQNPELESVLSDLNACRTAPSKALGVPEILKQFVALALAGRG